MNAKHLIQLVLAICAAAVVAPNPASAQQKTAATKPTTEEWWDAKSARGPQKACFFKAGFG